MDDLKTLMIFELEYGGHHAFWIKHLLEQSKQQRKFRQIHVVVTTRFLAVHSDVIRWALQHCQAASFHCADENDVTDSRVQGHSNSFIIQRYNSLLYFWVNKLKPDSCFLSNFGPFQFSFALQRQFRKQTAFSGIHFSPIFHYRSIFKQRIDRAETIRALRQKILMRLALLSSQLKTVFFLDQYATDYLSAFNNGKKAKFLPDPAEIVPENPAMLEQLAVELQIESGRITFLLFGALTARKGIFVLLEAIALLPAEVARTVTIIFAGVVREQERQAFIEQLAKVQKESLCQIILLERFVSDEEAVQLFYLSEVILAPYVKHVGMSGILMRAAAAGKPVIISDFGLLGRLAQDMKLGLAVDTASPGSIATAIAHLTDGSIRQASFDKACLQDLAHKHSIENFAKTIFDNV